VVLRLERGGRNCKFAIYNIKLSEKQGIDNNPDMT
jgi:hypothetical protein